MFRKLIKAQLAVVIYQALIRDDFAPRAPGGGWGVARVGLWGEVAWRQRRSWRPNEGRKAEKHMVAVP